MIRCRDLHLARHLQRFNSQVTLHFSVFSTISLHARHRPTPFGWPEPQLADFPSRISYLSGIWMVVCLIASWRLSSKQNPSKNRDLLNLWQTIFFFQSYFCTKLLLLGFYPICLRWIVFAQGIRYKHIYIATIKCLQY